MSTKMIKAIVAVPVFFILLALLIMGLASLSDYFFRSTIATILSIPLGILAIVLALLIAKKASEGIEEILK